MYFLSDLFSGKKGAFTVGNAAKFKAYAADYDLSLVCVELNLVVVSLDIDVDKVVDYCSFNAALNFCTNSGLMLAIRSASSNE